MQNVYRDGRFDPDIWSILEDGAPVPEQGFVLLSKDRWLAERDSLTSAAISIGLVLYAGEEIGELVRDLSHFRVIALDFPKFADGRSYSTARLLREDHGYSGELRAIGDVLIDQIPLMLRCGFDTFAISHEPTRLSLENGHLPNVTLYTQPIADRHEVPAGTRPWLRIPVQA